MTQISDGREANKLEIKYKLTQKLKKCLATCINSAIFRRKLIVWVGEDHGNGHTHSDYPHLLEIGSALKSAHAGIHIDQTCTHIFVAGTL